MMDSFISGPQILSIPEWLGDLGGNNRLAVDVRLFNSQVTSSVSVTNPLRSCRYIIDDMFNTSSVEK